ncbi:bifunctional phosphoribosyl-AMP cyclohydrolase/phosphoribosyl-ATP diphosphatase HisIE [Shewanella morhuae]|uniref:bifunctional phosphoribosyl-AMP cyclohydrolase/phosphoribosyl-ATP diphosphatase HisIE n=1 Tax=Shewanella morhuae TaxID=365591 RepID=UPI001BBF31A2|nr:bifunctional phosphoribosyl-AMP cyclohydrolase/phosphoribosyl-ATP diphosphatase HisIE [Shewanella morhuae]GIU06172.1 histidine biosynthesis bifunctional protein HisIE [Shewanella morhuae]
MSTQTNTQSDFSELDWDKQDGLIPAVIQNHLSGKVLMLGYMDKAALAKTLETGDVTFFSRSKQRLWTKGETSGNTLKLVAIDKDCDNDSLLVQVIPNGPTCHKGTESCWLDDNAHPFLNNLASLITSRKGQSADSSYTASLFKSGTKRIAQKVGEEGLETALAAATHDKEELVNEASDLIYHLLVLLEDQNLSLSDITANLLARHEKALQHK